MERRACSLRRADADGTGPRRAAQACGETLSLTPETLRSLGAAKESTEALAAKRRAAASPSH